MSDAGPAPLLPAVYEPIIRRALAEDVGRAGDITTDAVIPSGTRGTGMLVAREAGCIAGLAIAIATFQMLDPETAAKQSVTDGETVGPGAVLATVDGPLGSILTAERTALNILGHLSGIATATRRLVDTVAGSGVRITDTRKTTPGLRALEKYAVRTGGGVNHRFGLDDAVLVKDNHVLVAGGVGEAVRRARARIGHLVKVEAEVDRIDQIDEAIEAGADVVLLDNMSPDELRRAVEIVAGRALTEASGGMTPESIGEVAASGVDLISLGWLTHSAPSLDVALDLEPV